MPVRMARYASRYAREHRNGVDEATPAQTVSSGRPPLRLQAERRLGEMLRDMPKAGGAKGIGPIAVPSENRNTTPTLAEIGIDKKVSMRAQRLAAPAMTRPPTEGERAGWGAGHSYDAQHHNRVTIPSPRCPIKRCDTHSTTVTKEVIK